jgi:UDP-N-acetylglucosamine--N-acetylmuramyl-(pentapeptide) pyrophosphoryl-undecaprenol N-acetylglucosamine transferase
VTYHGNFDGKLRRYFSWQNFIDPFRVIKGYFQARKLIREIQPSVIFSKGGFVSVPVVLGAGKVPVVAHESDYSPGLSNRIATRFTDKVCLSFEDTLQHVSKGKGIFTGTPIRPALYDGDRERALAFTGLTGEKPVLLVWAAVSARKSSTNSSARGRSFASGMISFTSAEKGKTTATVSMRLHQYEYIDKELPDLFALERRRALPRGSNSGLSCSRSTSPACSCR